MCYVAELNSCTKEFYKYTKLYLIKCRDEVNKSIQLGKLTCGMNKLDNSSIFMKFFYGVGFNFRKHTDTTKLMEYDKQFLDGFYKVENNNNQQLLNPHTDGLYRYIHYISKIPTQDIKDTVYIEVSSYALAIGFIESNPLAHYSTYISQISKKDGNFLAFANNFFCLNPTILLQSMNFKLLNESKINTTTLYISNVSNPCLNKGFIFPVFNKKLNFVCAKEFDVSFNNNIVGNFDRKLCFDYIKLFLYDPNVYNSCKGCNFYNFSSYIIPNNTKNIILRNSVLNITNITVHDFIKLVDDSLENYCNANIDQLTQNDKLRLVTFCVHSLVMFIIFTKYISVDQHILISSSLIHFDRDKGLKMLLVSDPRLGISIQPYIPLNRQSIPSNSTVKKAPMLFLNTIFVLSFQSIISYSYTFQKCLTMTLIFPTVLSIFFAFKLSLEFYLGVKIINNTFKNNL